MTSPRPRLVRVPTPQGASASGRGRLALAAALLAVGSLTACSGDGGSDGADDPAEVLAEAKQQLDDTPGLRLSLRTEELPDGVDGILVASGVGTHAPAFEGQITVLFNGLSANVPVVAVDGKVYAKLPFGGSGFDEINPDDYGAPDPAMLMDPEAGVAAWLTSATTVEKGEQSRDGKLVLTDYTATVPGEAVAAVIPSADDVSGFPATFSLDSDNRLVSAEITGQFYNGKAQVTYTLELSDYGTDKEITAP